MPSTKLQSLSSSNNAKNPHHARLHTIHSPGRIDQQQCYGTEETSNNDQAARDPYYSSDSMLLNGLTRGVVTRSSHELKRQRNNIHKKVLKYSKKQQIQGSEPGQSRDRFGTEANRKGSIDSNTTNSAYKRVSIGRQSSKNIRSRQKLKESATTMSSNFFSDIEKQQRSMAAQIANQYLKQTTKNKSN